jgi:outer membrane protein assembly factor BamB
VRRGGTTISCRLFARIAVAALVVASGAAGRAQQPPPVGQPPPVQQPPLTPAAPAPRPAQPVPAAPKPDAGFVSSIKWNKPLSAAAQGAPAFAGGQIVIALAPDVLAARSTKDGEETWRRSRAIDRPIATDGELIVVAFGAQIQAFDAATGRPRWQASTGKLTAPLTVHGGWVVVAADGQVTLLRATDGSSVWTQPVGVVREASAIGEDRLYVPVSDGRLVAYELGTGKQLWDVDIGGEPTSPAVIGHRVCLASSAKQFLCFKATRELDWKRDVGARVIGTAAADDKRIYFTAMDNQVHALDRNSGSQKWKWALAYRPVGGPIVLGTLVVVPGLTGTLPGLDAQTGKERGKLALPDPLAVLPAFAVPGPDGALAAAALITNNDANEWKLALAVPPPAPPAGKGVPAAAK